MNLSLKISLLIFLLAIMFSVSLIGLNHFVLQKDLNASQLEWANTVAHAVAEGVAYDTINGDDLNAHDKLKMIVQKDVALEYAYITDFDGNLFVHTFDQGFPRALIDHVKQAGKKEYADARFVLENNEVEDVAIPLVEGMRAQLHIGINQQEINGLLKQIEKDILWVVLLFSVTGSFIAVLIGRRISLPLAELSTWVKQYGKGECNDCPSLVASVPEVANLVDSFNEMTRDRSQIESELNESEAFNRKLVESIPIGLALTRMDGSLVDINPAYSEIVGHTIDELKQLSYWDLTPEEYAEEEKKQLHSLETTGRYGPYEKEYIHADGHRIPVRLQGRMIKRHGEDFIWSSVENITERKHAERVLQRSHEELEKLVNVRTAELIQAKEEAERSSAAKSEFLSRMSHELRTPLNAILGFGQLLELEIDKLTESQRDNIHEIMGAGHHLLDLINDVLDLAKIESGKLEVSMEAVSVDEVLKQAIALIQTELDTQQIKLIDHISGNDFMVNADFTRLKQVLLNLLSNAVKYNRSQGRITLQAEPVDKNLHIRISDTGHGMTEDEMDKLFTSFERMNTENSAEGTGIGLVITKNLVELMGGNIGVESSKGEGSSFWIDLLLTDKH